MQQVIDGKRYDTQTATLVARGHYRVNKPFEPYDHHIALYRTPTGRYFAIDAPGWQGGREILTPISEAEAVELYMYGLPEHLVEFEDAFPDVVVEDA